MTTNKFAKIVGMGAYLPSRVLSNHDLEKMVDTSDEWIVSRTGMRERRIAAKDEHASHMGAAAARKALADADMGIEEIDLIIVATMSPDYPSPSTATLVQHELGAKNCAAFDLQAACSGYLYALSTAQAFVESGKFKNVLLVAAEKMSSLVDYTDRTTCVLFGDGAAAAVISAEGAGFRIGEMVLGSDGSVHEALYVKAGGSRVPVCEETLKQKEQFIQMNGRELFRHAVRRMKQAVEACLEKANCKKEEISWIVPHQANTRIIDALAKQLDIPLDRVCSKVEKMGNTSAASIGLAMDALTREKEIKLGEKVLFVAFGAGLTWGACLLEKEKD